MKKRRRRGMLRAGKREVKDGFEWEFKNGIEI